MQEVKPIFAKKIQQTPFFILFLATFVCFPRSYNVIHNYYIVIMWCGGCCVIAISHSLRVVQP
jgi:hypothetical protein